MNHFSGMQKTIGNFLTEKVHFLTLLVPVSIFTGIVLADDQFCEV